MRRSKATTFVGKPNCSCRLFFILGCHGSLRAPIDCHGISRLPIITHDLAWVGLEGGRKSRLCFVHRIPLCFIIFYIGSYTLYELTFSDSTVFVVLCSEIASCVGAPEDRPSAGRTTKCSNSCASFGRSRSRTTSHGRLVRLLEPRSSCREQSLGFSTSFKFPATSSRIFSHFFDMSFEEERRHDAIRKSSSVTRYERW